MAGTKRVITEAVAACVCAVVAAACSTPTSPGQAAGTSIAGAAQAIGAPAGGTPQDFAARGWECRNSPVPGRVVCSHPNQGFPAVPPPADRPATYQLRAWQDGIFAGNILLMHPDIYNNQICESTGQPFIFRPVIGYYECLHTVGN